MPGLSAAASTNMNDIKSAEPSYDASLSYLTDDGFQYPKNSTAYRMQHKAAMGQKKMMQMQKFRDKDGKRQVAFEKEGAPAQPLQILKREDSLTFNNKSINTVEEAVHPIDTASISVLIGSKGRNISIICRTAYVLATINKNAEVHFVSKSDQSDLDLAHRMMISMTSGGVLRWFNHPAATNKYYHPSVRKELEDLVEATSECTLDILRAFNGHLCLMLIPAKGANKQYIAEQIKNLRPIVLEKMNSLAQQYHPSTNDPTYNPEADRPVSQCECHGV